MQQKWHEVLATKQMNEWVDLIQTNTGRFFRFLVENGELYRWNRQTTAWDDVTAQAATIISNGALQPITVQNLY